MVLAEFMWHHSELLASLCIPKTHQSETAAIMLSGSILAASLFWNLTISGIIGSHLLGICPPAEDLVEDGMYNRCVCSFGVCSWTIMSLIYEWLADGTYIYFNGTRFDGLAKQSVSFKEVGSIRRHDDIWVLIGASIRKEFSLRWISGINLVT